jgi:hypothetical protein
MKNKALGAGAGAVFSLLVILILGMVHPLGAGLKAGAELRIVTKDGTKVKGELLAVKARTLIINSAYDVSGISLSLDEIRDLAMVGEKSKTLSGFGIGLLAGTMTGALGGLLVSVPQNSFVGQGAYVAGFAGLGALAGALVGLIAGSAMHQAEPLIVGYEYQLEPDALLKKLRAAAKDPEYR